MQKGLAYRAIKDLKGVQLSLWLAVQLGVDGKVPAEINFDQLGALVDQLKSTYWSVGRGLRMLERKGFLRRMPGTKRRDHRYLVVTRIEDMPDYDPNKEPVQSLVNMVQTASAPTSRPAGALSDGQRKDIRDYIHFQKFHQWQVFEKTISESNRIAGQYPYLGANDAIKHHFDSAMWPQISRNESLTDDEWLELYDATKVQVAARMNGRG